jgi:hypothetical protein
MLKNKRSKKEKWKFTNTVPIYRVPSVCAIPDAGGIPIKKITKAPAFLELIQ